MSEQLALIDAGRVYEDERIAWDSTEAYYSRPEYAWPLVRYLVDVAGLHAARHDEILASRFADRALGQGSVIVEPCVGGGALVDGMQRYLRELEQHVLTGDVRDVGADWIGDWTDLPKSWQWNRQSLHFLPHAWLVATNPPFSLARQVVEASWRHCPEAIVAILQRASWYEPTADRGAWLQQHNPDQITIGRCEFFRPDGSSAGKGDSTSYTWYVFMPRATGGSGPRGGHHEIIPWKEAPHV